MRSRSLIGASEATKTSGIFSLDEGMKGIGPEISATHILVIMCGGGGSGAVYGGGGGGGAVAVAKNLPVTAGTTYTITVGAGSPSRGLQAAVTPGGGTTTAFGQSCQGGGDAGGYVQIAPGSGANRGGNHPYTTNYTTAGSAMTITAPFSGTTSSSWAGTYFGGGSTNGGGYGQGGGAGAGGHGNSGSNFFSTYAGNGGNGVVLAGTNATYNYDYGNSMSTITDHVSGAFCQDGYSVFMLGAGGGGSCYGGSADGYACQVGAIYSGAGAGCGGGGDYDVDYRYSYYSAYMPDWLSAFDYRSTSNVPSPVRGTQSSARGGLYGAPSGTGRGGDGWRHHGGGGGGTAYAPTSGATQSGAGGSGFVLIRYPRINKFKIYKTATATTGSPMYRLYDGNHFYIFTGSGSITF